MTEEQRQELLRSFEETRKLSFEHLESYKKIHAVDQEFRKESNDIWEAARRSHSEVTEELKVAARRDWICFAATLLCVAVVVADIIVRLRH